MEPEKIAELFKRIQEAQSQDELGDAPEDFQIWCYWKYKQIKLKSNIKDVRGNPSLETLMGRLMEYPSDFSWAISEYEILVDRVDEKERIFKALRGKYKLEAIKQLRAEKITQPPVDIIEAKIEEINPGMLEQKQKELSNLKLKMDSLEKHISIWMKLDKIYIALMDELNSEFWRTYKKYNNNQPKRVKDHIEDSQLEEKRLQEFIRKGLNGPTN